MSTLFVNYPFGDFQTKTDLTLVKNTYMTVHIKTLAALVGQKLLSWIRLIMIFYIVLSYQIAFRNSESACCLDWNRIILAILNLHNTPMPPIKFQLNPTCHVEDIFWRISRWLPWWPSWIFEWNNFSNSESPCHPNASHQLSAQSNLPFGSRCGLKIFKMAPMVAILDIGTELL